MHEVMLVLHSSVEQTTIKSTEGNYFLKIEHILARAHRSSSHIGTSVQTCHPKLFVLIKFLLLKLIMRVRWASYFPIHPYLTHLAKISQRATLPWSLQTSGCISNWFWELWTKWEPTWQGLVYLLKAASSSTSKGLIAEMFGFGCVMSNA